MRIYTNKLNQFSTTCTGTCKTDPVRVTPFKNLYTLEKSDPIIRLVSALTMAEIQTHSLYVAWNVESTHMQYRIFKALMPVCDAVFFPAATLYTTFSH